MGIYRIYTARSNWYTGRQFIRRNILIIGDGSYQVTAQELSTILRQNLKPIIFLINNNGYTVERAIHGQNQPYNDIQMWDYTSLPNLFGSEEKA